MKDSYDLQNAWYRDSKEPIEPQLLQATLAIYTSQWQSPYALRDGMDVMVWAVRLARDLLTTIRMNEADAAGGIPDPTVKPSADVSKSLFP